jgi:murein DD-endopeptidase MepM/ murein hydrolase activator NlpD
VRWRKKAIPSRSRRLRATAFLVAAAGALSIVLLAACGGSSESEEPTQTPRQTPRVSTPSPEPAAFQYEIQEGDSLYALALRFNTTVDEIMALNQLASADALSIGDVILIPGEPPADLPSPNVVPRNPIGSGWAFPIEAACLPNIERLMPNAPREYRAGIHEGVDFYAGHNCATVLEGTPVLAAKAGTVVRADHGFVEMTEGQLNELLNRSKAQGFTDEEGLDRFRGRQVWVDHGQGTVTRYAHLSAIPTAIREGKAVQARDLIGYVGDSGTPEAVTDPGVEIHLHFEIRVGDTYLGAGLPPDQTRRLWEQAFAPAPP